jgi:very-short-patch-repair endonuclease
MPLTTEQFIYNAKQIHGDKFDYSQTTYVHSKKRINIICLIHGLQTMLPSVHINNIGCSLCGIENTAKAHRFSREEFIERANQVHNNNKYDYSKVIYKNTLTKVEIICLEHGSFFTTPSLHIYQFEVGCPSCNTNQYKMEKRISLWFKKHNIFFVEQKTFEDLNVSKPLRFDFFIPSLNLLVEYDGQQHFRPAFGNENFERIKEYDCLKNNFAITHNINLLRISYKQKKNYETILQKAIFGN